MSQDQTKVSISLGERADFLMAGGQLFATQHSTNGILIHVVPLGTATKARINELKEYLDRLSVHAVDA